MPTTSGSFEPLNLLVGRDIRSIGGGVHPNARHLKGSISFGLVIFPVAVYPATREEKISFKQLRAKDLSPIRYKKG
jgi:hypothetical protein